MHAQLLLALTELQNLIDLLQHLREFPVKAILWKAVVQWVLDED
jgi:hypothetical protein